jgi:hypothetical protein
MLSLSMMSSKRRRLDLALSQLALPNGKLLASASDDQTARLWDAATRAALQTLEGLGDVVRGGGAAVEGGVEVTKSLGFLNLTTFSLASTLNVPNFPRQKLSNQSTTRARHLPSSLFPPPPIHIPRRRLVLYFSSSSQRCSCRARHISAARSVAGTASCPARPSARSKLAAVLESQITSVLPVPVDGVTFIPSQACVSVCSCSSVVWPTHVLIYVMKSPSRWSPVATSLWERNPESILRSCILRVDPHRVVFPAHCASSKPRR